MAIKEVTTRQDLKEFVKFPNRLYRDNRYYVPKLISAEMNALSAGKNPAFEFCEAKYWLAHNGGNRIVGRIAGIINHRYNEKTATNFVRFGWIDFIEDEDVVNALFATAESWARGKKAEYIHGPLGMSDFDESGVLVEGFSELATAYGKYNFPYYGEMIERYGFRKEVDWVEYNVRVPDALPGKYSQMAEFLADRYGLRCAKISGKRNLLEYADRIFELLNREYDCIHGFYELTPKQTEELKKQFIPLLRLKFVSVILNSVNKVVGFGICLPSLSKALQRAGGRLFPFGFIHIHRALRFNDTLDALLIAIQGDYRDKGLNALIFSDIGDPIIKSGITNIETTRELEHNFTVQNLWNKFEYRQHKRARCYVKKL